MGNLCGKNHKEHQQHDVDNRHKRTHEGQLNPLSPPRPTAPAPVRPQPAGTAGSAGVANAAGTSATARNVRELDEWYNVLVRKLWPFINPAVTKMANEMLPDLLQQSKPTWMTRLEMTKFQLGDNPIELTKLDVADGPDPGQDDIFLDFDIKWDAPHLDFELAVNPLPKFMAGLPGIKQATSITVGVEDFFLEGRVRVSMVPLIKEIPVVGALQISLLGMPRFDMNLTLGVFDGLESVIKPWLKSFVEDFVLEAYQLPGHYFLPLANGIPDVQTPAGVLELTVVEAVNVPKMDYFSQSSPYCQLWLTGAKKDAVKTPYVDTTKNPKWDPARSTFGFAVHAPTHQKLVVALYDYDGVGADDEIGRTMISLSDLGDAQPQDFWVSFETPEQEAERKKHEEMQAQGKSDHDIKHRDQNGNKKGILQRTQDAVVHALVPAAGGHDKQLPSCRVRVKAVYHSLEKDDVRRLNEAQGANRRPDITMIHEAATRRAVERFALMDQILGAKKETPGAGGAGTGNGAQQGDKDRAGKDSAQAQSEPAKGGSAGAGVNSGSGFNGGVNSGGANGGYNSGGYGGVGRGGAEGVRPLGGGGPGQQVGGLAGPGHHPVGAGGAQRIPGPQGLSQLA